MTFKDLKVAVYADGADIEGMKAMYASGFVKGFTTNPSLMKKAGVKDYVSFAKDVVKAIPDLPLSFEVFGDDFDTMEKEAQIIAKLGSNKDSDYAYRYDEHSPSHQKTFSTGNSA